MTAVLILKQSVRIRRTRRLCPRQRRCHEKATGEALGVNEQLANLQGELEALRKDVRVRDEAMVNLKKGMVTLRAEHDELEQYTRRNSVRLTGLTEATNENVYDIVMTIFNEEVGLSPPITLEEIDRIHRVGKADPTQRRSILVKTL